MSRINGIILGFPRFSELINRIQPDIIHSHGYRADVLISKLDKNYIRISTAHNYAFDDYRMKYGNVKGFLLGNNNINKFKRLDAVIACSYTIAEKLDSHKIKNVMVVQNGIDRDYFYPITEDKRLELKRKLGVSTDKKIFLSIGSLIKRKNPIQIIKSVKNTNFNDIEMIFLGDGPLLNQCKTLVQDDPRFRFAGNVSNPDEYLKVADFYISASKSEGLPNSVLEAIATGVPVILSNIDSHKEILKSNSSVGLTFKLDSIESLSNAIKKAINMQFHQDEIVSVSEYFSAERMSREYQTIYKQLKKKYV